VTGRARLYALPGSAPSYAGELMLRHKAVPYRRIDLIPGRHRRQLRARGFPGGTVPAIELDGRRIQTNRAIAKGLDELVPAAPLYPAEPAARARVEEAERFGDEQLQPLTRRIVLRSLVEDPRAVRAHRAIGSLPVPFGGYRVRVVFFGPSLRYYGATAEQVRRDKAELPGLLDTVDAQIEAGVLAGEKLHAADLQIGVLVAALEGAREFEAEVRRRPAALLARRVLS
jgi:glutathione S-transferase